MACVAVLPVEMYPDEDALNVSGRRRALTDTLVTYGASGSSKMIDELDAISDSESAKATTHYTDDDRDDCESICSLATDDGYWEAPVRPSLSYSSSPPPSIVGHYRSNSSSSSSSQARIHDVEFDATSEHASSGGVNPLPLSTSSSQAGVCDDRVVSSGNFVPVGMPMTCMGTMAVFVPMNMPVWGYSLQQASLAGQMQPSGGCQPHRAPAPAAKCTPSPQHRHEEQQEQTTIIMRNLPADCTRDVLRRILDTEGFACLYDFIHVPVDFQSKSCLGYGLVNLVNRAVATHAHTHFQGFTNWVGLRDSGACEVAWNEPKQQGLAALTERYRNSTLMHPSITDSIRPQIFQDGLAIVFPAPTMRLRPPRLRHQKSGASD
jgi:hypothetical protein